MTTTRMELEKMVAGVTRHSDLFSFFNTNADIIDAYLAKSNWNAGALDPDADNDDSEGYAAGSRWYTTTAIWECTDASTGTAVWRQVWPALTTELSGSITNAQLAGSIADDKLANSYAILAGRAGGQTLRGDTASGGNLILDSTAHVTKGNVLIQPSGGRVGFITSSPLAELHLAGVASRLLIGDAIATADNAKTAWQMEVYTDGNAYLSTKTHSGGTIYFRCGEGTEVGTVRNYATVDPTQGNIYCLADVSALSFTDRTPHFMGDALAAIQRIRARGNEIDHATLPEFAVTPYQDDEGQWWPGRSLGDMISVLVTWAQQYRAKAEDELAKRDEQISALMRRVEALENA